MAASARASSDGDGGAPSDGDGDAARDGGRAISPAAGAKDGSRSAALAMVALAALAAATRRRPRAGAA